MSGRHWSAEEIELLGTDRDDVIAIRLGRPKCAVTAKRCKLGIRPQRKQGWTAEETALLGRLPDAEIAARTGRSLVAVRTKRREAGVLAPHVRSCQRCGEHFPCDHWKALYCPACKGAMRGEARLRRKARAIARNAAKRETAPNQLCRVCGKPFRRAHPNGSSQIVCSQECRDVHQKTYGQVAYKKELILCSQVDVLRLQALTVGKK